MTESAQQRLDQISKPDEVPGQEHHHRPKGPVASVLEQHVDSLLGAPSTARLQWRWQ